MFTFMTFLSAGMLLIRCTTIVLLALIGGWWSFVYLGVDLALYLSIKIIRGDFWHWMPLGGKGELLNSIIMRIVLKVVVDFTSLVQFRHPNEVGGLYWMFGFVLTMGSLPVAIHIAESPQLQNRALPLAVSVATYIVPITITFFGLFFMTINKKYWHTFLSMQRGKDLTIQNFTEGEEEAKAKYSFKMSKHHWISIEEDVKAWVEANWVRWERDKPEWFTAEIKKRVPIEYIPTTAAKRKESVRRASLDAETKGGLEGVLRASLRRASVGLGGDVARVVPMEEDN